MIRKNYYLIILAVAFLYLGCNKKQIKPPAPLEPQVTKQRTLQIIPLVNQTDDPTYDLYAQAIPEYLKKELKMVKKIKLKKDFVLVTNVDAIADQLEEDDYDRYYRGQEILRDVSEDFVSGEILRKQKALEELQNIDADDRNEEYEEILKERWFLRNVKDRLHYVNIRKKKVINDFVERASEQELENFLTAELEVKHEFYSGKEFEPDEIFDLGVLYEKLSTKGGSGSGDLFLLGSIDKQKKSVKVTIKGYDANTNAFFFDYEDKFSTQDFNINFDIRISKFARKIAIELANFPQGVIWVKTKPKKSVVYLDGMRIGMTPLKRSVSIGEHDVEILKRGYDKVKGKITIKENKISKIKYVLGKETRYGKIRVLSAPSQADVYLDLKYLGKTPLTKNKIKVGFYKLKIEKEGYNPIIEFVTIDNKKPKSVNHKLTIYNKEKFDPDASASSLNKAKNICFYGFLMSLTGVVAYQYEFNRLGDILEKKKDDSKDPELYEGFIHRGIDERHSQVENLMNVYIVIGVGTLLSSLILQYLELQAHDVPIGIDLYDPLSLKFGFGGNSMMFYSTF